MKNLLRSFCALALTAALMCPVAAAAGEPTLLMEDGRGGTRLTLKNLGNSSVSSVQLELTLSGSYSQAGFTAGSSSDGRYSHCKVDQSNGQTTITIYIDSLRTLNQGGSAPLGTLTLGGGYTAPSSARLTLLDRNLKPGSGEGGQKIAVQNVSSSSGGGSSTGGGDSSSGGGSAGNGTETKPLPFTDVKEGVWFHDAVAYAYTNGLMAGTSATTFGPDLPTSRGMIVTILYRLAGSPASGAAGFTDVAPGQYYAAAVDWAAENGVVSGYGNGRFGPNDPITREQMAVILRGYARLKGRDVSAQTDLSGYTDAGKVSGYAREAMSWASAQGLINGTSPVTLSPSGTATRAQAAMILWNFCENVISGG